MMKVSWHLVFGIGAMANLQQERQFPRKNGSEKRFLYQCLFHFHLKRNFIGVNSNFGICSNKESFFIYLFNILGGDCFA